MTLGECAQNAGRPVTYRPHDPEHPEEHGVITSVNGANAMVRFCGELGSRAANPARLTLAVPEAAG